MYTVFPADIEFKYKGRAICIFNIHISLIYFSGLFGRGLKTRIVANGCQGLMFAVLWKYFMEYQKKRDMKKNEQ
jgi:hypothetical protein